MRDTRGGSRSSSMGTRRRSRIKGIGGRMRRHIRASLPLRSLSRTRSDGGSSPRRRGRSLSSERRESRFINLRGRSKSVSRSSSSERRFHRSDSEERRQRQGLRKDALLSNYSKFLSRARRNSSRNRNPDWDMEAQDFHQEQRQEQRPKRGIFSRHRRHDYHTAGNSSSNNTRTNERPCLSSAQYTICPRSDIWFAFATSSCAAIATFGQIISSTGSKGGAADKVALSSCAISFMVSFVCAVGIRYTPFRNAFTASIGRPVDGGVRSRRRGITVMLQSSNLTLELLTLSFLSILWIITIPLINNIGNSLSQENLEFVLVGNDVWNANLFYSSWISCLLCWYLWIEVWTLHDRNGLVPRVEAPNSPHTGWGSNVITKRWILISLFSMIILSSSVKIYSGPTCAGNLKQTEYCSRALIGIVVGGFIEFILTISVGVLYRLANMQSSYGRGNSNILSMTMRNKFSFSVAVLSILVQATNVGILTSPVGGGPATSNGTPYFASWAEFVLVFELCLRYIEFFSLYGADGTLDIWDPPNENSRFSRQRELPYITHERSVGSNKREGRSTGTVSSTSCEEDDASAILQIDNGHADFDSRASKPQYGSSSTSRRNNSPSRFGSSESFKGHLEPEEKSIRRKEAIGKEIRNISTGGDPSRGSSNGSSGRNPDGLYYKNSKSMNATSKEFDNIPPDTAAHAFGQQTSFHVDKLEELDHPHEYRHANKTSRMGNRRNIPSQKKSDIDGSLSPLLECSFDSCPATISPLDESKKFDIPKSNASHGYYKPSSKSSSRQSSTPSKSRNKQNHNSSSSTNHYSTVSEGMSTHDTLSTLSGPSKMVSRESYQQSHPGSKKGHNKSRSTPQPPPPPFQRNHIMQSNDGNNHLNTAPIESIKNYKHQDSDTTISDTSIDYDLDIAVKANAVKKEKPTSKPPQQHRSSSSTGSYQKRDSDSTENTKYKISNSASSLKDFPQDEMGVDKIVAAALAYAEKTQGRDTFPSNVRSSGTSKKASFNKQENCDTTNRSIHSFYSNSQKSHANKPSTGECDRKTSPIDELVASVLSNADQTIVNERVKTPSSLSASVSRRSMTSMFSEDSLQDDISIGQQQFDC